MAVTRCDDYHAELFNLPRAEGPGHGKHEAVDESDDKVTTKVVTPDTASPTEGVVTK
ncbi:hypothetical protein [Gordonia sp. N1V]|uniref:hypothetical protein n=1 Tax=Gordonia sp. N1V TaxID=3034163 RepID=UPI0023E11FBF|nr:hypothetical protein [Gordonia sp. N1V]MDF3280918.1 hypothetical protein [Gordonia sp. N1V]